MLVNSLQSSPPPTEPANNSGLLRFITAGSVDDGKSTLIGRLLFDSKQIFSDQLQALSRARHQHSTNDELDLALLTDGLEAEREQGITIDVAYRYFSTPKRKFIIADTPGHEQYTRNMVTGASTADAMVILIDASKIRFRADDGVDGGTDYSTEFSAELLTQTKRHSCIARLLQIEQVIVAVNKMDLVDYSASVYQKIIDAYQTFATQLGLRQVQALPMSALSGDNVVTRSSNMPWYSGPTLIELLESLAGGIAPAQAPFRFPVQWVIRDNGHGSLPFRGYAGRIEGGSVSVGDQLITQPGARRAQVRAIQTFDGALAHASADQAVTLVLSEELDISRGDMLSTVAQPPVTLKSLRADLCWLADEALDPSRKYWLKHTTRRVTAQIDQIDSVLDVNTQQRHAASTLKLNDIARVSIRLQQSIAADAYTANRRCGAFILIDQLSHETVAAGMIRLDTPPSSELVGPDAGA